MPDVEQKPEDKPEEKNDMDLGGKADPDAPHEAPETSEAGIGGPIPAQTMPDHVIDHVAEAAANEHKEEFEEDDVPEGVFIENDAPPTKLTPLSASTALLSSRFADAQVGQNGRFRINPETGVREPVYERYTDPDGKSKIRRAV